MIRCIPKGICSWNFFLEGAGHHADLEFNWWGEQGAITADGTSFDVQKHGMLSGHWTLDKAGKTVVSAHKSSLTRTFEIQTPAETLLMRAESPFGRSFRVERSNDPLATIRPDHPFTRRATIETCGEGWDFTVIAFSFWLTVLTWRRAASRSSGATTGVS